MLEHKKIRSLEDFFAPLDSRQGREVYFYRINGYNDQIGGFIKKYYEVARRTGVVIEGRIPNPDEKNLAYYREIMGMEFRKDLDFIKKSLAKWLPRMNDFQRNTVAGAIFDCLNMLEKNGKNENMQKNAYVKFMCWLYYKFERVTSQLGENSIPKILLEGEIGNYDLLLISMLSNAGCDVVFLQYQGDANYLKHDPDSKLSEELRLDGMGPFPEGYSLKRLREEIQNDYNNERLYGTRPEVNNCTNAWIKGNGFSDLQVNVTQRGSDPKFFYNCFYRINGAEDKMVYANTLFLLQQELRSAGRKVVIESGEIPKPTPEEIAGIKRGSYARQDQMILDLAGNIRSLPNMLLQRIIHKAFVDIMLAESKKSGSNLNKLTNKAVYLMCWLKRYAGFLFPAWKLPEIGCFIYLGGCKNENEAMFMSFLARLPVDVLILCPNLNTKCCLEDKLLYELNYSESLALDRYPEDSSMIKMGTVAYHAERELDELMYQDSGMYRNQQYTKANVINLQTMYEEIKILWDQELRFRPSFSTVDGVVNIPVIYAKVCGVKDGELPPYWKSIAELQTPETIVVKGVPFIHADEPNPFKGCTSDFFKNGRLQKAKIKNHPGYPYGILREDIQDFMLEKLEVMISQRLVKGIGENGMEYSVIAQVLNLPKDVVRMIQKFDFTKKNPKLLYINVTETVMTLEDTIAVAYLNLIGFDILFFIPTGYQSIEKHFNKILMEEHQIGEYKYDLQVPDLKRLLLNSTRPTWREKIFKRGK